MEALKSMMELTHHGRHGAHPVLLAVEQRAETLVKLLVPLMTAHGMLSKISICGRALGVDVEPVHAIGLTTRALPFRIVVVGTGRTPIYITAGAVDRFLRRGISVRVPSHIGLVPAVCRTSLYLLTTRDARWRLAGELRCFTPLVSFSLGTLISTTLFLGAPEDPWRLFWLVSGIDP